MSRQWKNDDFQREFSESEKWTNSTYLSDVKIKGSAVEIVVELENCEPNEHATYIAKIANQHIKWIVSNIEMILSYVASKMTSLANQWLQEGESEMTEEDFKKRILLERISISGVGEFDTNIPIKDGNIILYFFDDEIFAGHTIQVFVYEGYVLDEDPTLIG